MNILVFGKNGQLGKAFQSVFDSKGLGELHQIQYVGRTQCDIGNEGALTAFLQQTKPNVIINAAAYTAVDQAEKEVDLAYAINAKAPEIMAHYAIERGATLLHYSTDYVFDGTKANPYLESDVRNPLGIYGKSKAAGEAAIEDAFKHHHKEQAQFAILRTSWVYGDGNNFIRTILHLAKERETLKENHHLRSFPSGIYHAVPQGETTWHALACYAVQVAIVAGATLKLCTDQIEAIPASEYPLQAPRPMNSRMARLALDALMINNLECSGDMPKWQEWQQSWHMSVGAYVRDLVTKQLI
jgi:dTDP-4-dehydrorhamnose reductase